MRFLANYFELSRGGSGANVRPMEGIRGFAVLLVFLTHYVTLINPWLPHGSEVAFAASLIHKIGHAGVDLFFILSGYLIYGSLMHRSQPFLAFMGRRVRRIYPTFLCMLGIYLVLSFLRPAESKIPPGLMEGAVYVAANILLLPGLFPIEPIMTVAWSLSYEMFFYLVLPGVVAALRLRQRTDTWRAALFMLMIALLTALYIAIDGGPVRMVMFIVGMLLYDAIAARRQAPSSVAGAVLLAAGLLCALLPLSGAVGYATRICLQAVLLGLACHACFSRPGILAAAMSYTPLRWLGNMSYSYYLMHGLVLKIAFFALERLMPSTDSPLALFLGLLGPMFLLTLLGSAALFLLVERPLSLHTAHPAPLPAAA